MPNNELIDTSQCTDEKPCYFCEVNIEFSNAKLTDEIEKETKVKKRTFARQKFFAKRLAEGQNDVHKSPLFHKKKLIEDCTRIEYEGELQGNFTSLNVIEKFTLIKDGSK